MNDDESLLLRWRGQVSGPFPLTRIMQMLDEHDIGMWHEVHDQGRWLPLEEFLQQREQRRSVAERVRLVPSPPPLAAEAPAPQPAPQPPTESWAATPVAAAVPPAVAPPRQFRPKRFPIFAALGLGLGFLGAHNFYAGYWGTAIAQVLLTAATWWLGFGFVATWLWALLELFLVHTDRRGVRLE